MSVNTFLFTTWSRYVSLFIVGSTLLLSVFQYVHASPGAHGPNGEHLDTNKPHVSTTPKFESYTEAFELVGELLEDKLLIYLHDFPSNRFVNNASIELESGGVSTSATYSEKLNAYVITSHEILEILRKTGEHEIILTVMSEESGDLMISYLSNAAQDNALEEHHHFPWFEILVLVVVFIFGFLLATIKKGKQE